MVRNIFSQNSRVTLLVWKSRERERNRGSENSYMILGVSNQGNYIQSNVDSFLFAGTWEQAAVLPQLILPQLRGRTFATLGSFKCEWENKGEACAAKQHCSNEVIRIERNCSFCSKHFIRSLYEQIDCTCRALQTPSAPANTTVGLCWLSVEPAQKKNGKAT